MSIKRTKQASGGRSSRSSAPAFKGFGAPAPTAKEPNWQEDVASQPDDAFQAYAMTSHFAKGTLLNHPVFGKGIVLNVDGRKIAVLFADGQKSLAHAAG